MKIAFTQDSISSSADFQCTFVDDQVQTANKRRLKQTCLLRCTYVSQLFYWIKLSKALPIDLNIFPPAA